VIPAERGGAHNFCVWRPSPNSPGGTMLEWKFRLVILLALAGTVAAALGSLAGFHNYGW